MTHITIHGSDASANYSLDRSEDQVVSLQFTGLQPGPKRLEVCRIDTQCRWDEDSLELCPLERRYIDTRERYECQILLPADSVATVCLTEYEKEACSS